MTLKTPHVAPQAWEEWQSRFGCLANVTFRTVQIGILNGVTSTLVSGVGAIAILWFGGWLVIQQALSIGQLLVFNDLNDLRSQERLQRSTRSHLRWGITFIVAIGLWGDRS